MKLLILDKDGTLVQSKSGEKWVQSPEDQELIPGVLETLKRYKDGCYAIAIVTNQCGVAAGHKTLESAIDEVRYAMELIDIKYNAYLCTDFDGKECYHVANDDPVFPGSYPIHNNENAQCYVGKFRKPNSGMIDFHRNWAGVDAKDLLYVGDRPEDQQAAINAGVEFMWVNDWINSKP